MVIEVNMIQTVALGVIMFLIGEMIVCRIQWLQKYCIPAPVVGGLIFAIVHALGVQSGVFAFDFNQTLKDFFMIGFFSTIGFMASLRIVKQGGIAIIIMLFVSIVMLIIQNIWGVSMARSFDLSPLIGLSAGSISLMGGIGTAAALAPIMEANGAEGALTIAVASATFGLVMGGLVSGPIARYLIDKNDLHRKAIAGDSRRRNYQKCYANLVIEDDDPETIQTKDLSKGFFLIMIAMGVGSIISLLISKTGIVFPAYVGAILAAAFIRNFADSYRLTLPQREISAIGNVFLSIFLVMTIMSLEIWKIGGMAIPLLVILLGQVILLTLYTIVVVYNVTGRDYDSAVMSAGFYGYAMGATPNAMASMSAVVAKYRRPSPKAYFTIPIVGGFAIDLTMSIIVLGHMNLLIAGIL
ncbi:sodium--glutamate symport carrier GltS [Desulfitobacterium dichloroeliminans LMG P-21439]|uniref:Sodium/glutamate symporter n=1 Tax=Desulfitobacterium dichloroeliminans (strain LMG P-21439 / DCA1) TaxID=871963 RepID=L0F3B9_DESDL|nr:sodium--glutamate symport carrier GltS [Desulfitobacterium dichloroeliminans LMG P-21439]